MPSDRTRSPEYYRNRIPHWDPGEIPQLITLRLIDSFPACRLEQWKEELQSLPADQAESEIGRRLDEYLDKGFGAAWLADPTIAEVVCAALRYFDGVRYNLHAWTVMPNHLHVLVTPKEGHHLSTIIQSWKIFTARNANQILNRTGAFWQRNYFDRFIRDERHFASAITYIDHNPVKAGLCAAPEHWPFGSAYAPESSDSTRRLEIGSPNLA